MIECVVNVSEGRDDAVLDALADAAGPDLLDVHRDAHHHRSVFTLVGTDAVRRLSRAALERLDIADHTGVHPRLGVVDVVPFVDLDRPHEVTARSLAARDDFARWAAAELRVPVFLYGPERTLPEVRRRALVDLAPDLGPSRAHPRAGAMCVGARPVLVAYNVWLPRGVDIGVVRAVATAVRRPGIRTLALLVGDRPQVSMNLVEPWRVGPADAFDAVAEQCAAHGITTDGAELVGLVPREVLDAVDAARWAALDLAPDRTIEARAGR